jgi:hypothetical protein
VFYSTVCRCVPTGAHTLNFGIKLSLVSSLEPQNSVHRKVRGPQKPSGKAPERRNTAFSQVLWKIYVVLFGTIDVNFGTLFTVH